jgi:two-component system, OmpR family, sensor kinase
VSIRLRLALWYSALFTLILLIVALLSYAFHTRGHYDDIDRALITSASHAAAEAAMMSDAPHLVRGSGGLDVVLRLYDATGTLQETSDPARATPPTNPIAVLQSPAGPAFDPLAALVPPLAMQALGPGSGAFGLLSVGSQRWRTYVFPLQHGGQSVGYVEALIPLARLDRSIHAYQLMLLALGVNGVIAALVGSWFIARRALQPISEMIETAREIETTGSIAQRIPLPSRRDELGRLAETFNAMLVSLEEGFRAQQRFVSDASHELRAPLTAIQGNLELLRRQRAMPEAEREEALAEAEREAARLTRLVSDLLALARADAGVSLDHRPVDLDTVVLDAFGMARQLARGQTLNLDAFEPVQVHGDADRLKQLVLILLDNALKYTSANGHVTLELRRTETHALIIVCDTGVGIPTDALPHVFERFYRADPARSRDPGGTGLGLSIARWIVEQHSGTIVLQSQLGQGTTVRVRLPRSS